jgi:hypothetical protein
MSQPDHLWDAYQASQWPSEGLLRELVNDPGPTLAVHQELYPVAVVLGIGNPQGHNVTANLATLLGRAENVKGQVETALKEALSAAGGAPREQIAALLSGDSSAGLASTELGGRVSSIRQHFTDNERVPEATFSGWANTVLDELYPPVKEQVKEALSPQAIWDELVRNKRFELLAEKNKASETIPPGVYATLMARIFAEDGPVIVAQLINSFGLKEVYEGDFELLSVVLTPENLQKLQMDQVSALLAGTGLKRQQKLGVNISIRAVVRGKSHMTTLMI